MKKVILESPYAGNIKRNVAYAEMCLKDSLNRGEAPLASHLLYPRVLNDKKKKERRMGIDAGLAWMKCADLHVFYIDFGYSEGMLYAKAHSNLKIEERRIMLHVDYE